MTEDWIEQTLLPRRWQWVTHPRHDLKPHLIDGPDRHGNIRGLRFTGTEWEPSPHRLDEWEPISEHPDIDAAAAYETARITAELRSDPNALRRISGAGRMDEVRALTLCDGDPVAAYVLIAEWCKTVA